MLDQTSHYALEIENLSSWYGEGQALFDISIQLERGQTVAIIGRNGVGKSTTLRSIVGLTDKRRGSIRVNGTEVISAQRHKIAYHGIGYVPEERGIFSSLNVEENLQLPPKTSDKAMSLDEIYAMFPNLYERRHSIGTNLSGGEQQMLSIARVLRSGAQILLLDEPTEGLAPVIVQQISDVIYGLKSKGYSILLVEQNLKFARRVADRFYALDEGHVVADLDRADVEANPDVLKKYLEV